MATANQEKLLEALRHNGDFPENLSEVWNDLLEILQNENEEDLLNHYLFRQGGTGGDYDNNTIIDKIQRLADLNGNAWTQIKSTDNFWNESVAAAITHYRNCFSAADDNPLYDGSPWTFWDMKWADAGLDFKVEQWVVPHWVAPWINIDGEEYIEVRGTDAIYEDVLNNEVDLQFTHSQNKKWIRLLMPMYTRHVEIEDLDRNFWVIGQVISGISGYLFDDNSPITTAIENLLREITELWENILYLWAALAMLNRKEYTDVHKEVIYLPVDEYRPYLKYDGFRINKPGWNGIADYCQYLIQEYPESNLVILVAKRQGNYYHNYYSTEKYCGFLIYNRNNPSKSYNGFYVVSFGGENDDEETSTSEATGAISLSRPLPRDGDTETYIYADYCYGVKEEGNSYYYYPYRYVDDDILDISSTPYYGMMRVEPYFDAVYDTNTKSVKVTNFSLDVSDVSRIFTGTTSASVSPLKIGELTLDNSIPHNTTIDAPSATFVTDKINRILKTTRVGGLTPLGSLTPKEPVLSTATNVGHYKGELITNYKQPKEIDFAVDNVEVNMPPITSNAANNKVFYQDILEVKDNIQAKNKRILQGYLRDVAGTPEQIVLYTGTRVFDLYKSEGITDDSEKRKIIAEATGYGGLGGYYTTRGTSTTLYKREDLKEDFENKLYDETLENGLSQYNDKLIFNGKNEAYLPYAIYSKIQIPTLGDDYGFIANEIGGNTNAYTANVSTLATDLVNAYNNTKFDGAHGGKIDLGAMLTIPGFGTTTYSSYESYRVLPTAYSYPQATESNGCYRIWLKGESKGAIRHTWNDSTSMVFYNGDTLTPYNWCIVYIKTYGVYAPCGALKDPDRQIDNSDVVHGYGTKGATTGGANFYPIVCGVHTHVFMPNSVYARHSKEFWAYQGAGDRSQMTEDNFDWVPSGKVEIENPDVFNNIKSLIQNITPSNVANQTVVANGYRAKKWISSSTHFVKDSSGNYSRESQESTCYYNFYRHPINGHS